MGVWFGEGGQGSQPPAPSPKPLGFVAVEVEAFGLAFHGPIHGLGGGAGEGRDHWSLALPRKLC